MKAIPGINYDDGKVSFEAHSWDEARRGMVALVGIGAAMGAEPIIDEILQRDPQWPKIQRAREGVFWERWIALETERAH